MDTPKEFSLNDLTRPSSNSDLGRTSGAPEPPRTAGHVRAGRYVPPVTMPRNGTVLGDVTIDEEYVHTPLGRLRRDRTRWTIGQTVPGPRRTPTWASLCAVIFFFVIGPFSLLFLLAKEQVGEETTVQLTDGRVTHTMRVFHSDDDGYLHIGRVIEWSERALED